MPNLWPARYKKTTDRRKEWQALKKTHAADIKASKVDFDAKLGKAIDDFELQVKKITAEDYGKKSTTKSWTTMGAAAQRLSAAAIYYKGKLTSLPAAAKNDLKPFLAALEADSKLWSAAAQNPTPTDDGVVLTGDWARIADAIGHLQTLLKRGKDHLLAIVETRALESAAAQKANSQISPARLAFLAEVETQVDALLQAAAPALKAAQRLEAVRGNMRTDPTYLKVFKADVAQAVKGPFARLRQAIQSWRSIQNFDRVGVESKMVAATTKDLLVFLADIEAEARKL